MSISNGNSGILGMVVIMIGDRKLIGRDTMNWQEHEKHSEVYAGKGCQKYERETMENGIRPWKDSK